MKKNRMSWLALICVICVVVAAALAWQFHLRFLSYRAVVASAQKDPESSKFTEERITSGGIYCASVNSKNGYGGYGGALRVISDGQCYAQFEDGEVHSAPQESTSAALAQCAYNVSTLRTNLLLDTQLTYLKDKKFRLDHPDSFAAPEAELRRAATMEVFRGKWGDMCQ